MERIAAFVVLAVISVAVILRLLAKSLALIIFCMIAPILDVEASETIRMEQRYIKGGMDYIKTIYPNK